MPLTITLPLADAEATEALGARLAAACDNGALLTLQGELGAGKTTLVRGLLRALGHRGTVKSPTYTLVEPYEIGARRIYHFDLYRLTAAAELEAIGLRDYLEAEALCVVEWPERAHGALPVADLAIMLDYADSARSATITAGTARGAVMLEQL